MKDWERGDLISNLVIALGDCREKIQERMISLLTECDKDYGMRVAEGLKSHRTSSEEKMDEAVQKAEERSHPSDPY